MPIALRPAYEDLNFMAPLSEERADKLVRFLASGNGELVVDFGCGWAELLIRTLEAAKGMRGLGFDFNEERIQHGRKIAELRGVADRIELVSGDARNGVYPQADALICIGSSQIWGPEEQGALDYRAALEAMRAVLPVGGRVVYGEGIWSVPPSESAIAPLGGRKDEFLFLPELLTMAVECGYSIENSHEASLEEWDAFEAGYVSAYWAWLEEHGDDHPYSVEVRARAEGQRQAYFEGYREVLGFAYLELVAV